MLAMKFDLVYAIHAFWSDDSTGISLFPISVLSLLLAVKTLSEHTTSYSTKNISLLNIRISLRLLTPDTLLRLKNADE